MKNISTFINESLNSADTIILEAFKSSTLRDVYNSLRGDYKSTNTKAGNHMLPHGIAWDQIEDSEIFYGESGDPAFIKKFVKNPDYFIIWYPLSTKEYKYNKSNRNTWSIEPGNIYITCGNEFFMYDARNTTWSARLEATYSWGDDTPSSRLDKNVFTTDNKDMLVKPSIKDWKGFHQGHLTVKVLSEDVYCSAIAIHKDTLVKYSTLELMKNRAESKRDAVALLKKDISHAQRRINNGLDSGFKYVSGWDKVEIVDYPSVRFGNKERYKKILQSASASTILKRYVPKLNYLHKCIEDTMPTKATSSNILKLSGEEFANTFFSYNTGKDIRAFNTTLTQKVNAIMERIETLAGNFEDGSSPSNNPSIKYILTSIDTLINDATDFAKANIGNFSSIKKS